MPAFAFHPHQSRSVARQQPSQQGAGVSSSESSGSVHDPPDAGSSDRLTVSRGDSADLQADIDAKPAEGAPEALQHQPGKPAMDLEDYAAQECEPGQRGDSASLELHAERIDSSPESIACTPDIAASPAGQLASQECEADHTGNHQLMCDDGPISAETPCTGGVVSHSSMQESSYAAGLQLQGRLNEQNGVVAELARGKSQGNVADAAEAEGAEVKRTASGAGSGRRSKPFSYGPRTQAATKLLPSSAVYGIAADGSAASLQIRHAQPDEVLADRSSLPPGKPFAYGPRGVTSDAA